MICAFEKLIRIYQDTHGRVLFLTGILRNNNFCRSIRDCEKKSVNKILLWYAKVVSLQFELFTLVLYITVVEWHVKSRRFSACLDRRFTRYSGRRPSYIILSSPYTCAQFRIVLVHFFVASKVARYSAFKRAVSLGNTLLCRFSFREVEFRDSIALVV